MTRGTNLWYTVLMMMLSRIGQVLSAATVLLAPRALAATMNVGTAWRSPAAILSSVIGVLDASIYGVALAVFVVGAFLYATSAGKEERKNLGKDFMIGAVVGFFLVRAARLIFGTVLLYLYAA